MMVDCHLPEPQNQSITFGPTQMIMAPHHTHYSEYEQKNNLLQMLGTIFRCILNRIEVVSIFLIYVIAFCVLIFSKNQNATEMQPIMISILFSVTILQKFILLSRKRTLHQHHFQGLSVKLAKAYLDMHALSGI